MQHINTDIRDLALAHPELTAEDDEGVALPLGFHDPALLYQASLSIGWKADKGDFENLCLAGEWAQRTALAGWAMGVLDGIIERKYIFRFVALTDCVLFCAL